jgi:hypothetical protein
VTARPRFRVILHKYGWDAQTYEMFATREEAEALLATLPKLLRGHVVTCGYGDGRPWTYDVRAFARMREAKGNKANETGYKRFKKLVEIAELQVVHGTLDIEEALAWYGAQCE